MDYLGDFQPGQIVDYKFATADLSGAPITLAGSPAISVYKGNGTTESTTGVTLTVDFDARTGLHHLRVDTSADASFYAGANDFQAVITAGTVNGVSVVGRVLAGFSLHNRMMSEAVFYGAVTGSPTVNGFIDTTLTQADASFWVGRVVIFLSGTQKGQAQPITAFNQSTHAITVVPAFTTAPANGDKYVIV